MLLFVRRKISMLTLLIKAFDPEILASRITNGLKQKRNKKSILFPLISLSIKSAIAAIVLRVKRCGSAQPTQQWVNIPIIALKAT
jgi:hypothetical protein